MTELNPTKKALAASMKKLMLKKPFDKVSVSDICNGCGINRKSFYYHFRDKYDLANWIFYTAFMEEIGPDCPAQGWDLLRRICRFFYADRAFYRSALSYEGQNSLRAYITEILHPMSAGFFQEIFPDYEEDSFTGIFLTDSLLFSITRWLGGGYGSELDADAFLSRVEIIVVRIADSLEAQAAPASREDQEDAGPALAEETEV